MSSELVSRIAVAAILAPVVIAPPGSAARRCCCWASSRSRSGCTSSTDLAHAAPDPADGPLGGIGIVVAAYGAA